VRQRLEIVVLIALMAFCALEWIGMRRAYAAGDLAGVELREQRLRWLPLPLGIVDDAASERVLTCLRTGARDAAHFVAACFVGRDGFAAHPTLGGFLAVEIRSSLDAHGVVDRTLGALTARLCFERPVCDATAADATKALRSVLEEAVARQVGAERTGAAVSALAGCGNLGSLACIVEWLERCEADRTPDLGECARLAVVAASRIAARAETCKVDNDPVVLRSVVERLARTDCAGPHLDQAWKDLEVALARAQRRSGVDLALGKRALVLLPSAMRRDRDVRERLRSLGPRAVIDTMDSAEIAVEVYGRLVGCYADEAWAEEQRASVLAYSASARLAADQALAAYDEGLQRARELLEDPYPFERADADAVLGAHLEPVRRPVQRLPVRAIQASESRDPLPVETVACFDLQTDPIEGVNAIGQLWVTRGTHDADRTQVDRHYLRLVPVGRARVSGTVRIVRPEIERLFVRFYVQKAVRDQLPFGGEVALRIACDDRVVADACPVIGRSAQEVSVAVEGLDAAGDHTIEVSLTPGSTTGVRLYSLRIAWQ
jgi:hypothetical protein